MDEQRFLHACQLRDEQKLTDAYDEFSRLVESTTDPLDKALVLLHAVSTLEMSSQIELATGQLRTARSLIEKSRLTKSPGDEKFAAAELFLDYEDANLAWLRGENPQVTLHRFEAVIEKHSLTSVCKGDGRGPKDLYLGNFCESIQIRRAFILADLGRWKEALPILQEIKSPHEYREGVAFYLGHCYLASHDYIRAEQKLTEALKLGGLPRSLEYRAHCELGMTCYNLQDYVKAREELEKGAQLADASYIKDSQIWKWLELTCRALGLTAEAERYASMFGPS